MKKQLLILGAGTAGTMMANHLRKKLPGDWSVTVVDRSEQHLYQPGLLFLPFGIYSESQIVRPTRNFLKSGIQFVHDEVAQVEADQNQVQLKSGTTLSYDVLIVATGCRTAPEETEGMLGAEWRKSIFDFYTLDGARQLQTALKSFSGGRLVIHINEMPIKCPVAPLEFCFLADWYFHQRGIRDKVELTYVTPLSGAFTKPEAARTLGHMLTDKKINLVTDFAAEKIDADTKTLVCYDGREVPFDLLVTTPTNMGDMAIRNSGMGDDLDFIATHKHTLQSLNFPNVFVLGDATNLPSSKAGSVAHFQAETLTDNILRHVNGQPLKEEFDGHSNCFIESGFGKALLIDFNYTIDPHQGRFPFWFGPLKLLHESRLNHWGKLAFRWIYWYLLLPARWIPGITRNKTVLPKSKGEG
ncbi:MAG: FAD/NAD(P)-binding oxidoreductase [Planctomycetaceae bacterium]